VTASSRAARVFGDHRRALQMIYDHFAERGAWPTFGELDRPLRKLGIESETVVEQLTPLLLLPFQAGRSQPIARDELRLTLNGIAACHGGKEDIVLLLRLMPWLADQELNFVPDAERPELRVSRSAIAAFLQLPIESVVIRRLHLIIGQQRWGWSGGEDADGEWFIQVHHNIYRFAKVQTLEDYLAVMQKWEDEGKRPYASIPDNFYVPVDSYAYSAGPPPEREPYVPAAIVADIQEAAAQSTYECTKLLSLIEELNDSYGSGGTYSAHAMLRAILDHVPPLLGYETFAGVVNNYAWNRTDKLYMKRLADFRSQADDVLHRQISKKADLLAIDDMPQRIAVSRLLQECAEKFTTPTPIPSSR
jgi:hypothetical protein